MPGSEIRDRVLGDNPHADRRSPHAHVVSALREAAQTTIGWSGWAFVVAETPELYSNIDHWSLVFDL